MENVFLKNVAEGNVAFEFVWVWLFWNDAPGVGI